MFDLVFDFVMIDCYDFVYCVIVDDVMYDCFVYVVKGDVDVVYVEDVFVGVDDVVLYDLFDDCCVFVVGEYVCFVGFF